MCIRHRYYYTRGFNPKALIALVPATVVAAVLALVPAFGVWAPFSWAIGVILATAFYLPMAWSTRRDAEVTA